MDISFYDSLRDALGLIHLAKMYILKADDIANGPDAFYDDLMDIVEDLMNCEAVLYWYLEEK